ncbi:MAG: hypothetical protein IPK33_24160 [Gemmatimonadetes bacterium]|nr:hypothetical protein [Gemmatimonadota bacterium]
MAVGIGALGALAGGAAAKRGLDQRAAVATGDYPPAMTGLRGSHDGAFENAHRVRDGMAPREWSTPADLKESYALIVVGAGIGAERGVVLPPTLGASARILIPTTTTTSAATPGATSSPSTASRLISYGGTQSIDTPSKYSPEAKRLLRELGIDTQPFYKAYDQGSSPVARWATGSSSTARSSGAMRSCCTTRKSRSRVRRAHAASPIR